MPRNRTKVGITVGSRWIRYVTGRRTKFVLLGLWCAVVLLAGPFAGKLTGAENNDNKAFLPGSAESVKVLDLELSFQSSHLLPAVVVYHRAGGLTDPDRAKVSADAVRLAQVARLDGTVTGPQFSVDGQAAELVVPLDLGPNDWKRSVDVVKQIQAIARSDPGLSASVTGSAGYAAASADVFNGIDSTLLYGTLLVVVLILLLTYRSPVLWMLPVLAAGVSLAVAEAVIYFLAVHAGLTVNAMSAGILTVLVFGAGTDYALLLVARYREELRRNEDRHHAMEIALRRAAPAIVASASTVIVGLSCLTFAESNATKGLGPVAAIGVAVAMLTMLTLLPPLLVTAGRWIFWPVHPRFGSAEPTASGPWARLGRRIERRPRRTWVLTALFLAVMALGVTTLHANGLTNAQSYRGHPDAVAGEELLARHFPGGTGSPVAVIADAGAASHVAAVVAHTPGIAQVTAPVVADGRTFVQATLLAPPDSANAYGVVDRLRSALHALPRANAMVGGSTAINLDVERAARHDRNLIIPIVLLVVFAILALLLRSLLAPLVLLATVVLSLFASFGFSAIVFTYVFGFAGADSALPLYAFVFLVALGIDYNIFLMTRVREESKHAGTAYGAITALAATGGVITSAGFVLAGTFAVLAALPLTTFTEVGFVVAFGVLLDTILVRSILVTALNIDIGDRIWWPSRLAPGPGMSPAVALEQPVATSVGADSRD